MEMNKQIVEKDIKEMCDNLKYYDENGHFPWEKKKILITIDYSLYEKLKREKINISKAVQNSLINC